MKCDRVSINDGDQMTVKIYETRALNVDNFSVCIPPILLRKNGGVHLLFDDTHGSELRWESVNERIRS